jgi:hypothetical protein
MFENKLTKQIDQQSENIQPREIEQKKEQT